MSDFEMKQGDTLPKLEFTCTDANGPVDISNATAVDLHIVRGTDVVVNVACVNLDDGITPSLKGRGEYEWDPSDTATILGTYEFEIQVTYPGGKVLTFPNGKTNPKIQINKQLA